MDEINGTEIENPNKTFGPNSNQGNEPKTTFWKYYSQVDKKTLEKIKDLFAEDFELFGYDSDIMKVKF